MNLDSTLGCGHGTDQTAFTTWASSGPGGRGAPDRLLRPHSRRKLSDRSVTGSFGPDGKAKT